MTDVRVGPVTIEVAAPPALVHQMLAAIGQGGDRDGERATLVDEGDERGRVFDFWTRVALPAGRERLVRTRERVRVMPPDRIEYEHLDGPVRGLIETIRVAPAADGGTRLSYVGTYRSRGLVDRLRATFLARPAIERVMRAHFADVRERAEARAVRSRVFAADAPSPTPDAP